MNDYFLCGSLEASLTLLHSKTKTLMGNCCVNTHTTEVIPKASMPGGEIYKTLYKGNAALKHILP